MSNIWVLYLLCRVYGYFRSPWDPAADTFIPLKRLSREFCTKNFWSHTAGGAFDNHVFFIRGTCLQSGTLSPGISYRSGGTPSWAKSSFENQRLDWCENEMRELVWELITRKLPQHIVLMSYWWRRGTHIVERTVRGAVSCKCSSNHTNMSLTFVVVKSR